MKKELVRPAAWNCIGGKEVMPIFASFGPYPPDGRVPKGTFPDYITDEYFKAFADMGANMIGYCHVDWEEYPELVIKSLDLAHKYGMGYTVADPDIFQYRTGDREQNLKKIAERVENYRHHPAFCGVSGVDEPTSPVYRPNPKKFISDFVELVDMLKELEVGYFPCALPAINYHIFPEIAENYRAYVEEFCETFRPEILHYDHYPFTNRAPEFDVYFWNMDLMRSYAKKMEVPMGVCIQAGGQWNDLCEYYDSIPYYPNEAQFDWNVNTCLAMGAKRINYFPAMQPFHYCWAKSTKYDFRRNGLIGCDGQKNPWYYYAQRMNKQIAAVDEVLMLSTNEGLIASGEQAKKDLSLTTCVIESGTFGELIGVEGNAIIGCFDYEGKTALYVVNHDMETSQVITLRLNKLCNITMVQNAVFSEVDAKIIELDMVAGEGILLVINEK